MRKIKRYWVSWNHPTEDYRPIKWPLPESFLGYWCTGSDFGQTYWTLCALVECEGSSKDLIKEFWPEVSEWRFCNEVEKDWLPEPSRFPLEELKEKLNNEHSK